MLPLYLSTCLLLFFAGCMGPLEQGLEAYRKGDYTTAVDIWGRLAETGDVDAQYNLAGLYLSGEGPPRDRARALMLYRNAARIGDPQAQYSLATMYRLGHGTAVDLVNAYIWYSAALQGGNPDATRARKQLLPYMSEEQVSEAQNRYAFCMGRFMQEC